MKHKTLGIAAVAVITAAAPALHAATLVWDSFSEGEINLSSSGGPNIVSSSITSPIVDTRDVEVYNNPDWSVTIESGFLTYHRDLLPGTLPGRSRFALSYSNQANGLYDILGYDAFVLDIVGVIGSGTLKVYRSGLSPRLDIFTIDSPGRLVIPLSDNPGTPIEDIREISFEFNPQTPEFKVRIAEITLVPEPSVPALAASGTLLLLLRRRRKR